MKRQHLVVALLVGSGILAAALITAHAAIVSPAFAQATDCFGPRSTTQRDAPTTRLYDSRGNATGTASTYGNQTRSYDSRGHSLGTAIRNNGAREKQ
jgi:hypothetical protein